MKTTATAVIVVIILIALGFWYQKSQQAVPAPVIAPVETIQTDPVVAPIQAEQTPAAAPTPAATTIDAGAGITATTETIKNSAISYTGSTFSPASLALKVGDSATFTNSGSAGIRVSSNPHPAHSEHPDFDSGLLGPKASWTYTFKTAGTYGFHNHLNPGVAGSITVK